MNKLWIDALREACDASTQAQIAQKIGMSPAVVNQILKGTYNGSLTNVQKRVEGALMGAVVDCPIGIDMPLNRCMEHQIRPFAATNPMRVQLFRACKTCKHNSRRES